MKSVLPVFLAILAFLLGGCALSHAESVPVDPDAAVGEVLSALGGSDEADALQAWRVAYGRFERTLEPALRKHCGDRATTALEYRFGQVRAALDAGTEPPIEALHEALDAGRRCLVQAADARS